MKLEDIVAGDVVKIVFESSHWCIAITKDSDLHSRDIMFTDLYSSDPELSDYDYYLDEDYNISIEFLYHHTTIDEEFAIRFPEYSI